MAFLTITELNTVSIKEIRDMITRNDDSIIETIIDESIDIMAGYISNYYDAEAVFAAEDDDRSKTVLKYLKDIVIYELYCTDHMAQLNDIVKMRYDEAMLWLSKMSKGQIQLNLPGLDTDTDGDGEIDGGYLWLDKGQQYESDF